MYPYLGDWLIKAGTPELTSAHLHLCIDILNKLGLRINYEKSTLIPVQRKHYLWAFLDTQEEKVYPSEERLLSIQLKCRSLARTHRPSASVISSLLGSMASCIFLVPHARLHMRSLQQCLEDQWNLFTDNWEKKLLLSQPALKSLLWWTKRINLMRGISFHQDLPAQVLVTDGSLRGWGAHMEGLQIQGLWSDR